MSFKYFIITLLLATSIQDCFSQKLNYEISDNPSRMFELKNYQRAKELYREKFKKDLSDKKIKYRFGICLIYSYEIKDGIKMLESVSLAQSTPTEIWYHLARAYHLSNRYDKAIKLYKKYIAKSGAKEVLITDSERNITMCINAKNLIQNTLNLEFENLGKRVNSKGREYLPFITPDEGLLFFTTRREGTTGRVYDLEGYYTSDIYMSKYKYGKWSRARSIGPPNSYGNESTAGITENGKSILYYVNSPKSKNNLQISKKTKSSFKKAIKIDSKEINSNDGVHSSAALSDDNDYIIFSSDRAGGTGKKDLYFCRKLPDGKWGKSVNLGNTINTIYDEAYPYLCNNGKTLYFSSTGHKTIGGYDIFVSHFDDEKETWSKPTNLGYPLNTPYDNFTVSFSENRKYGYVATHKNDSYGDLDIYRVNFKDNTPSLTTIKGYLLDVDSNTIKEPLRIEVFNKKTEELYGVFEVNQKKGSYLMILPPNDYEINIDVADKGYFKQSYVVPGRNLYRKEMERNITISFETNAATEN